MEIKPVVSDHDARVIMQYLRHKKPFFVEGGPGIGKSLAVSYYGRQVYRQFCSDIERNDDCGEPWWEPLKIDITEDTEVRHLLGEFDLIRYFCYAQGNPSELRNIEDFFVPGPLTRAITEGSAAHHRGAGPCRASDLVLDLFRCDRIPSSVRAGVAHHACGCGQPL